MWWKENKRDEPELALGRNLGDELTKTNVYYHNFEKTKPIPRNASVFSFSFTIQPIKTQESKNP